MNFRAKGEDIMNDRQIRILDELLDTDSAPQEVTQVEKVIEQPKFLEMVDKYSNLALELAALDKAHKDATLALRTEVDNLKKAAKVEAEKAKTPLLEGEEFRLEFSPKTTREITPDKFLIFLKAQGKTMEFLKFVKVGLTKAEEAFGTAVLNDNGVIDSETDDYFNIKVVPKLKQ